MHDFGFGAQLLAVNSARLREPWDGAILTGKMHAGMSSLLFLCIFDAAIVFQRLLFRGVSRMFPESFWKIAND